MHDMFYILNKRKCIRIINTRTSTELSGTKYSVYD